MNLAHEFLSIMRNEAPPTEVFGTIGIMVRALHMAEIQQGATSAAGRAMVNAAFIGELVPADRAVFLDTLHRYWHTFAILGVEGATGYATEVCMPWEGGS